MLSRTKILSCVYNSFPLDSILKQLDLACNFKTSRYIVYFHFLCTNSQMRFFTSGLPSQVSNIPSPLIRATCIVQCMFVELVTLLFRDEQEEWMSSLCSFSYLRIAFYLFCKISHIYTCACTVGKKLQCAIKIKNFVQTRIWKAEV